MEVEAHTHAIQWLASQLDEQITHAIILTDSMNLLQKVESGMGCPDWHTAMHSLRLQTFLWIYCPRHVGVNGNKQADRLTTYLLTPIAPGGAQAINDPSPSHSLLGCSGHSRPVGHLLFQLYFSVLPPTVARPVRAWCVALDAGFLRVCPIQPHFLRNICLATGSCCVSLVSTRKEAR